MEEEARATAKGGELVCYARTQRVADKEIDLWHVVDSDTPADFLTKQI